MTLLADLVATSRQVTATSARSVKTRLIADRLRSMEPLELEIAVSYLSGEIRQGRIGIGPSSLSQCLAEAASEPELQIGEVDRLLADLEAMRGSGSGARRSTALRELFGRATAEEQQFLFRLMVGELRQG